METVKATEKFIQWMKVKGLSNNTILNYSSQLKNFLTYHNGFIRPIEISSTQIMEYLLTKVAANTQRHAHSALKLFYTNIVHQPLKFRYMIALCFLFSQTESILSISLFSSGTGSFLSFLA